MVKRRHVYLVAGYDSVDAGRHHRRFMRGIATFARTWNVTAAVSELSYPAPSEPAQWTVTTWSGNWRVETTYRPLVWDDLLLADFAQPVLRRLLGYIKALVNFVGTGTAFRYFRASPRYGLFFLFPAFYLMAFAGLGVTLGLFLASRIPLGGIGGALAVAATATVVFFALLQWPGRRWRVHQALEDWIFSHAYLYRRRGDVEARLDEFAQELVQRVRAADCDEIVIVGHSLGATLAVSILARALLRDHLLGARGPSLCLLTVGSTIPKFTLHPAAEQTRAEIALVAAAPSVRWAEYHARVDPISFYKFDPLSGRIECDRFEGKPVIRLVRIRAMLEPQTYRAIQLKFMRLHYQFVMANERRNAYDYYMMGCGPIPFDQTVMSLNGACDLFAADGSLLEPGAPPARTARTA